MTDKIIKAIIIAVVLLTAAYVYLVVTLINQPTTIQY